MLFNIFSPSSISKFIVSLWFIGIIYPFKLFKGLIYKAHIEFSIGCKEWDVGIISI